MTRTPSPTPTTTTTTAPAPVTAPTTARTTAAATNPAQPCVVVLMVRRVRRRDPSAWVWRLLTYDPDTRTPAGDIASRWQPAGTPTTTGPGAVPQPVADWVTAVLGPEHAIGAPADDIAGPASWHIISPQPTQPSHDPAHRSHGEEARP